MSSLECSARSLSGAIDQFEIRWLRGTMSGASENLEQGSPETRSFKDLTSKYTINKLYNTWQVLVSGDQHNC